MMRSLLKQLKTRACQILSAFISLRLFGGSVSVTMVTEPLPYETTLKVCAKEVEFGTRSEQLFDVSRLWL